MYERKAEIRRKTRETDIVLKLDLNSTEESRISSGVPFFDHMLSALSKHGRFWLDLNCNGDLEIDDHHSVEDIGICLGLAVKTALGEKKGIERFAFASVPMDDALAEVSVDISGRPYFKYTGSPLQGKIGAYSEEMTIEFMTALAHNAGMNIHIRLACGENRHHIHEAIFKALAVSIRTAKAIVSDQIPSTKGVI